MNIILTTVCIASGVIGGSGVFGHPVITGTNWRAGVVVGVPLGLLIGAVGS